MSVRKHLFYGIILCVLQRIQIGKLDIMGEKDEREIYKTTKLI